MKNTNQCGFAHIGIIFLSALLVLGAVGFAGWRVYKSQKSDQTSSVNSSAAQESKPPDSDSTVESPEKVTTADGEQYFIYGAPAGQNNANPKHIIIDLPGHGTKAEDGYNAWIPYIQDSHYAVATLNWWDGEGERKEDYYTPSEALTQIQSFLKSQGYDKSDVIVLFGYSRGSANTYAVEANDRQTKSPVFDAVISASGGYQSDFPLLDGQQNGLASSTLYKGIYWILACGGTDPNPNRDGCPAMKNTTKPFLEQHGATVLAVLEDPNKGHGAFHQSPLNLPKQAFELLDARL